MVLAREQNHNYWETAIDDVAFHNSCGIEVLFRSCRKRVSFMEWVLIRIGNKLDIARFAACDMQNGVIKAVNARFPSNIGEF